MTNPTPHDGAVVEYGVRTPHSSVVLITTTDLAAAQHALTWIQDGHIVQRTLTVSPWQPTDSHTTATHPGWSEHDLDQTG